MALALCQSTLYLTVRLIKALSPQFSFPEHDVIDLLRDATCPEWLPAALWIGVAIATPVAEELFFRGLLQTVFARVMRSRRLAVVSAIPSIRPMAAGPTLRQLARKRGTRVSVISLLMSVKKLTRPSTSTFRLRGRPDAEDSSGSAAGPPG